MLGKEGYFCKNPQNVTVMTVFICYDHFRLPECLCLLGGRIN